VSPANYALHFSASAYLGLPDTQSLRPAGPFKTEFWFYPDSDVTADQFVFRGDPSVPADAAAPYVKVGRDLRITLGFGTGSAEVSAYTSNPVVTPGQWGARHRRVRRRPRRRQLHRPDQRQRRPVTGADVKARPVGNRITTISGRYDGVVGVIDGLKLWERRRPRRGLGIRHRQLRGQPADHARLLAERQQRPRLRRHPGALQRADHDADPGQPRDRRHRPCRSTAACSTSPSRAAPPP